MMDVNTVGTIPKEAWEQAVFVVLFLIFVAFVLRWFAKQQAAWQNFVETQNERWLLMVKNQEDEWNIAAHNQAEIWAKLYEKQDVRSNDSITLVASAVKELSQKMDEHERTAQTRTELLKDFIRENRSI